MAKNARQLCFDALCQVYRDGSYSSIALDRALGRGSLSQEDAALASALFYGVVERDLTFCAVIDQYSKRKSEKLDLEVAVILKMGLCQLTGFDHIPDRAAVNETVSLCYYAKKASAKGMVNAILRAFIRDGKETRLDGDNKFQRWSLAYSCPEWLIRKWAEEYSEETAEKLARSSLGRPPLSIRVNTLKTTDDELVKRLSARGIEMEENPYIAHCWQIKNSGSLAGLPEFQQGLFYVQDASSQFCAKLLNAMPGMTVYDLCAAPGSKSFTIAQWMEDQGEILAFDLHPHRKVLIEEGARRLGIQSIRAEVSDAAKFRKELPKADRVLCDVPCAGLGVIRRKPEIKYKPPESLKGLPELQKAILQNGSRYVKPGGRLLYSTCSLSREENEEVAAWFLEQNPQFAPVPLTEWEKIGRVEGNMATFFPHVTDSDGFFTALFERVSERDV